VNGFRERRSSPGIYESKPSSSHVFKQDDLCVDAKNQVSTPYARNAPVSSWDKAASRVFLECSYIVVSCTSNDILGEEII
jgi:hypothetical protein